MCDGGKKSVPILRNGLDYEPPKKKPPEVFEVNVREWQMSPFGNERYDLDEKQRLEKMGFKARKRLEMLKQQEQEKKDPCAKCRERKDYFPGRPYLPPEAQKCPPRYLYQPYGPPPVPQTPLSQTHFDRNPSPTSYPSPNLMPVRCLTCTTSERLPPVEYPEHFIMNRCESTLAGHGYVPYGPTPEIKINPDYYKPYGPSSLRTIFAHLN